MAHEEQTAPHDQMAANVVYAAGMNVGGVAHVEGRFEAVCTGPNGEVKWADEIQNTVCTIGKNLILDASLAGSAYTVTGPFMGLISGASAPTIAAADTMASHAGWLESGNANAPTYTSPRKTAAWSAASAGAKSLSAGLVFPITSSGTVAGGFLAAGTGALSTIDNTAGTLVSAGTFSGGNKIVGNGDTITISYTMTLT